MRKEYKLFIISLVFIACSFIPVLRLVPMFGCIVLWAMYMPFLARISFAFRLVLYFIIISCFQQVLGVVFWAIHLPLTIPIVTAFELVTVSCFYVRRAATKNPTSWLEPEDWISLSVAATTLVFLCLFVLHAGPNLNTLIRFSAPSTDETVHLDLTLRDYESQAYQYGVKTASPYDASPYYPQGWHFDNALWWRALSDHIQIGTLSGLRNTLLIYLATRFLWYGLLIYTFSRVALYICRLLWPKRLPRLEAPATFLLIGGIQLVWLLEILHAGFSSFVLQLLLSLTLIVFVVEFMRDSKRNELGAFLVGTSLLAAGMSLTWLLAMPIAVATALLSLSMSYKGEYLQLRRELLSHKYIAPITTSIAILVIGLFQFFVQVHYSHGAITLNTAGGIDSVNYLVVIIMATTSLVAIFRTKSHAVRDSFVNLTIWPLLLTGLVYLYQQWSTGEVSYYSIKIGWLASLILLVFGTAVIIGSLRLISQKLQVLPSLLSLAALIILTIVSVQMPLKSLQFLHYHLSVSPRVANEIIVTFPFITQPPYNTSVIVASNYLSEDTTASAFINVIHHDAVHGCWFPGTQNDIPQDIKWYRFDSNVLCYPSKNYIVLSGDNIRSTEEQYGALSNVRIVY